MNIRKKNNHTTQHPNQRNGGDNNDAGDDHVTDYTSKNNVTQKRMTQKQSTSQIHATEMHRLCSLSLAFG